MKSTSRILGGFLAFLTVLLILFLFMHEYFGIIKNADLVGTLYLVREYMIIGSLILNGFAFASRKGFILFIIFMAAALAVIVFSFFPVVRDVIMGKVGL